MRNTLRGAVIGGLAIALVLPMFFSQSKSAYVASIADAGGAVNTAGTATFFTCNSAHVDTSKSVVFAYPMTEASASTVASDSSGNAVSGAYSGTMTSSTDSRTACPRDSSLKFYLLNGTSSLLSSSAKAAAPASVSAEVWFKSTSVSGGQLFGFGSSQTGNSTKHDRQAFLTNAGKVAYFVNPGTGVTITSALSYNDGLWHQVIGQLSSTSGMTLYVDGALVGSNATTKTGATGQGYWRFGNDSLSGATGAPTSNFFSGSLRYGAVFGAVMSNTQVSADYRSGY